MTYPHQARRVRVVETLNQHMNYAEQVIRDNLEEIENTSARISDLQAQNEVLAGNVAEFKAAIKLLEKAVEQARVDKHIDQFVGQERP
jgi:chromosome segregation ATPase